MNGNASSLPQGTPLKSKCPLTPQHKAAKPPTPVAARTPDLPPPRIRNRRARRQINLQADEISASAKIPEKCQTLVEFFNCMDSSIRLLRIRGSQSTFSNIAPQIQSLTDRRFSYEHLAQIKCIFPEAVVLKRVLLFDERTCCMKPDLLITIDVNAIECDENSKPDMRKVFLERLAKFYEDHPEGDDIPQAVLPEPFNRKQNLCLDVTEATSSSLSIDAPINEQTDQSLVSLSTETGAPEENRFAPASHLSRWSFFGRVAKGRLQESVSPLPKPCLSKVSTANETFPCDLSLTGVSYEKNEGEQCSADGTSSVVAFKPCVPATPSKNMPATAEHLATPSLSTPGLHHPKRCYMSPDHDSASSPSKLVRRPPPTKSLKFDTPVKCTGDRQADIGDETEEDDIPNIFSEGLLKSIREKEEKAKEERDPAISQAKRREIEEQLHLLLELVPEWISEKLTSSGDLVFRINKMSSPETIRACLERAK